MRVEKNELGMSLFDNATNLEINMDSGYKEVEGFEEEAAPIDGEQDDDTSISELDKQFNLGEDENPEEVSGDEDHEDEGEYTDENSPNIYSSFASVLSEQGLLPSLDLQKDKPITTVDELTSSIKLEIENQAKGYIIDKIGQDGYDALNKGISLAEYQQYQDNVFTLENITEENLSEDIELSKKIIYQDYLNQGIDETRAMRLLKKSIDAGEDSIIEDARESLASLKVGETKRLQQLTVQRQEKAVADAQAQEQIDNDLKNSIYNKTEFFKGIKVNKTIQDTVYNSITKIVGKSPSGMMENKLMKDRRENPIDFDSKLYYLYEITNGFSDLSKITNKSETKAISKLERDLRKTKFEDSGAPSYLTDPESYGGIGSEIVF